MIILITLLMLVLGSVLQGAELNEKQTLSYAKALNAALLADNQTLNRIVQYQQEREAMESRFKVDMERLSATAAQAKQVYDVEKARILIELKCEKCDIDQSMKVVQPKESIKEK